MTNNYNVYKITIIISRKLFHLFVDSIITSNFILHSVYSITANGHKITNVMGHGV